MNLTLKKMETYHTREFVDSVSRRGRVLIGVGILKYVESIKIRIGSRGAWRIWVGVGDVVAQINVTR